MAQGVEHLPGKLETLDPIHSTAKTMIKKPKTPEAKPVEK
jgi:hypothetical protein